MSPSAAADMSSSAIVAFEPAGQLTFKSTSMKIEIYLKAHMM